MPRENRRQRRVDICLATSNFVISQNLYFVPGAHCPSRANEFWAYPRLSSLSYRYSSFGPMISRFERLERPHRSQVRQETLWE